MPTAKRDIPPSLPPPAFPSSLFLLAADTGVHFSQQVRSHERGHEGRQDRDGFPQPGEGRIVVRDDEIPVGHLIDKILRGEDQRRAPQRVEEGAVDGVGRGHERDRGLVLNIPSTSIKSVHARA